VAKLGNKHIHILGICGTFMGSLAILAKQKGFKVTGSDTNVYPPMSTYLQSQGIKIINGYDVGQIPEDVAEVVVGNCMTRGMPIIEYILDEGVPFTSGPAWLYENILVDKHVIAVSGTHGKTSTTSMLIKILQDNGFDPSFLIGGVSQDFKVSSKLTDSEYFVIEADEYDTAFFDKRSKFVHYHPQTLIINNLEFDHADIFDSIEDIYRQFNHMIRTLSSGVDIIYPNGDVHVQKVLEKECWSNCKPYGAGQAWHCQKQKADASELLIDSPTGEVRLCWGHIGEHNMQNAMSAIVAASCVGVLLKDAVLSLSTFKGVKRRLETVGVKDTITVYDDFAHHPTAIQKTISGLRAKVGAEKVIAIIEPRSNTMKMRVHQNAIAAALADADEVFIFEPPNIGLSLDKICHEMTVPCRVYQDVDQIVAEVTNAPIPKTHLLVMSNGAFSGIHQKLLNSL
jgi:UDP-N-acetylmuramate: L-alanyl-gamma-D-glutamyl-meso-diaminopimelate ligase